MSAPSTSRAAALSEHNIDEIDEDGLYIKDEELEIAKLELPETDDKKLPSAPTPFDEERIAKTDFRCVNCGMHEMVHYYGTSPPFVIGVKFREDTFVMRDPFQPPPPLKRAKAEYFIPIGAKCSECDRTVCKDAICSFFYTRTYCMNCAGRGIKDFPLDAQLKLRKQLAMKD